MLTAAVIGGALIVGFLTAVVVGLNFRIGQLEEHVATFAQVVEAMLRLPELTCEHGILKSLECEACARENAER